MLKFSGVVITYNEAKHIEKCLMSLASVVDEIIIVDSYSTDDTKPICLKHHVRFIEQEFLGYVEQKNFGIAQAKYDYIIALDGDEVLSDELQNSIVSLKNNWNFDGYYCNRLNFFCGQWIKHSDWYPNKKLRVFDRRKAKWIGDKIHENVKLNNGSREGKLKGDILHYTYESYSEFNLQTEKFSSLSAQEYFDKGKKAPFWKIIWNPLWAFFKAYILRLGILDGLNGLVICYQTGNITFLKYIKLRELYKNANHKISKT